MSMRLIAFTQYCENYGDAEKPYWKFKGGSEYQIGGEISYSEVIKLGSKGIRALVDAARSQIEYSDDMSSEEIIDFSLFPEGELTTYEKDQLEFEGKITDHPKVIAI